MTEAAAYQPTLPGMGADQPCRAHRFVGRGRWRTCVSCWWRGWFPR